MHKRMEQVLLHAQVQTGVSPEKEEQGLIGHEDIAEIHEYPLHCANLPTIVNCGQLNTYAPNGLTPHLLEQTVVRCFLHARMFYESTWLRNIRRLWKIQETRSLIETEYKMVVHSIK